ncbi:TPA: pheST operon leader peptide PheM [Enterobacter hormaechei subsp. xiangfangensis]|nr:pheST operon leader peptide PheM [Citrobacter sp.]
MNAAIFRFFLYFST